MNRTFSSNPSSNPIDAAQQYLTVATWNGRHHIADIRSLPHHHSYQAIVEFLEQLFAEQSRDAAQYLAGNPCDPRVDGAVANAFRVRMAIRALKHEIHTADHRAVA